MSAIRLPLLCVVAGGCLGGAVVFSFWQADARAGVQAAKQQRSPNVELLTPVVTSTITASRAEPEGDPVASAAAEPAREGADQSEPQAAHAVDSRGPESAGRPVSEVLMSLEAAYRARVAAAVTTPASSTQERAPAAAPLDSAIAATGSAPQTSPQPVAAVTPVAPVAVAPVAVAPVAVAPVAVAPERVAPERVALAPSAAPEQIAAAPAFAPPDDSRPSEVYMGDVNQNTYVTNVRQGDVYLIQMQQLATLQYMQLLSMSSGLPAPARRGRGAGAQGVPFSSAITNPDNPWGFHFAPLNLVR